MQKPLHEAEVPCKFVERKTSLWWSECIKSIVYENERDMQHENQKTPLQILNEVMSKNSLEGQWIISEEMPQMYRSILYIAGVHFGSGECVHGKKASMQKTANIILKDIRLLNLIVLRSSE